MRPAGLPQQHNKRGAMNRGSAAMAMHLTLGNCCVQFMGYPPNKRDKSMNNFRPLAMQDN
jgi:hypothetical protein